LKEANTKESRRLRLIIGVLFVVALIASLAGNVVLFRRASSNYRDANEVRLDPYGLKHAFYDPQSSKESDGPLVVFYGDSRAEQWPAPRGTGFRFLNRGIGGQTSEQVRGRFEIQVRPLKPRVLVVQAGINDLKTISQFPVRRDAIVADCKANLREVVRRGTQDGEVVIVTTIFPTGPVSVVRRMERLPEIDKAVGEVNDDLKSLASEKVIVLDAYSVLQSGGHVSGDLAVDTLHLNAKAYERLNGELVKLLERAAGGYASRP
jgi:lysophospholipase L1-like esterase